MASAGTTLQAAHRCRNPLLLRCFQPATMPPFWPAGAWLRRHSCSRMPSAIRRVGWPGDHRAASAGAGSSPPPSQSCASRASWWRPTAMAGSSRDAASQAVYRRGEASCDPNGARPDRRAGDLLGRPWYLPLGTAFVELYQSFIQLGQLLKLMGLWPAGAQVRGLPSSTARSVLGGRAAKAAALHGDVCDEGHGGTSRSAPAPRRRFPWNAAVRASARAGEGATRRRIDRRSNRARRSMCLRRPPRLSRFAAIRAEFEVPEGFRPTSSPRRPGSRDDPRCRARPRPAIPLGLDPVGSPGPRSGHAPWPPGAPASGSPTRSPTSARS